MVNEQVTDAREAEVALAIGYAPPDVRAALTAVLSLDARLGRLATTGREPMLAQMRLTWWHDALVRLDTAAPPAEPLLTAIKAEVLSRGVTGAGLAVMVDGWEATLATPLDEGALATIARDRGAMLFAVAATLLGDTMPAVVAAGEGWALADLSRRLAHPCAATMAQPRLDAALAVRWPRALRPLGALALLARADLDGTPAGSPRRVARLAWHRLTGR